MPELPEVEATRLALEHVVGLTFSLVRVLHPRTERRNRPGQVASRLDGTRLSALRRHGKFLVGALSNDMTLVAHLGMSGRMSLAGADDEVPTHMRFASVMGDVELRFIDPRTFGFVAVLTPKELKADPVSALGPDALTVQEGHLAARFAHTRRAVKAVLLDQQVVAGIGNIYADEILHRAGILPTRPASSLRDAEVVRLSAGITPILMAAIQSGGTSLDDLAYLLPDGMAGEGLASLNAYGRAGELCRRCGATMIRGVVAQRGTTWCPSCQH